MSRAVGEAALYDCRACARALAASFLVTARRTSWLPDAQDIMARLADSIALWHQSGHVGHWQPVVEVDDKGEVPA